MPLFLLIILTKNINTLNYNPRDEQQQSRGRYAQEPQYGAPGYGPQPPPPGYSTYFYKDRRYGYQPSFLNPYYNTGPTRSPEDRLAYEVRFILFKNCFSWF